MRQFKIETAARIVPRLVLKPDGTTDWVYMLDCFAPNPLTVGPREDKAKMEPVRK